MSDYRKKLEEAIREIPADKRCRLVVETCFRIHRAETGVIPLDLMGACPRCGSHREMSKDFWNLHCFDCFMEYSGSRSGEKREFRSSFRVGKIDEAPYILYHLRDPKWK